MGTRLWGPLGWMTLHSVAAAYPELPTNEDKLILNKYLEAFRETISCPHCKGHFTSMFRTYRQIHPEWANTRYDFFLFVCRAHNTVNKRLDKPRIQTLQDCITALQGIVKITSATNYRIAYLNYLTNNYRSQQSGDGFIAMNYVREMRKINEEYWNPRDSNFQGLVFVASGDVLEFVPEDSSRYNIGKNLPNASRFINSNISIGFKNGRLRLG